MSRHLNRHSVYVIFDAATDCDVLFSHFESPLLIALDSVDKGYEAIQMFPLWLEGGSIVFLIFVHNAASINSCCN